MKSIIICALFPFLFAANNCIGQSGVSCSNWLYTASQPSYVSVGDLDVPGNQITVEAMINRTTAYTGGPLYAGDIVSKHEDVTDANYLLRPNEAEITTSNGFFKTPDICDIQLNKTYHVAMVYDGSTLKFYRNGFLMSQVAATGNLIQNDWLTRIGLYYNGVTPEQFVGYINEVRIWNVARTQNQIRAFMNTSLPNPTAQPGLLAYYSFDNLVNKQGNPAWNGTLGGAAAINQLNPACATFVADSCETRSTQEYVINDYTEVLGVNVCNNSLTVADATKYKVGDTVLLIQMKGAVIDSSNSANFGTITDYKNAGNYEYNYVKNIAGKEIELKNTITRRYDIPAGKVQLVRVPYFQDYTVVSKLTCMPWDGAKGGVLAFNVQNSLSLNNDIDVTGKGFTGGKAKQNSNYVCDVSDYYITADDGSSAARKGEGIYQNLRLLNGRGKIANGGGGGNSTNAGGAGGGNAGAGGSGGKQYVGPLCNPNFVNGGIGGENLLYSNTANKIFLGGGAGAGQINDGILSSGGNGGGIVIISTNTLISNGYSIIANGESPVHLTGPNEDGRGGGGAGGTILLSYNSLADHTTLTAAGGNGDYCSGSIITNLHGPGGGGGGGVIWINTPSVSPLISTNISGGAAGTNINFSNNPWGATAGSDGITLTNLVLPIDAAAFKPNITAVQIDTTLVGCRQFTFSGQGYTNTSPVTNWVWSFGDGTSANSQDMMHSYTTAGNYTVLLEASDGNGCKAYDTILLQVKPDPLIVLSNDTSICKNSTAQLLASGGIEYNWSPAAGLNNPDIANPTATTSATTTYYVTVTDDRYCSNTDSVTVSVRPDPVFSVQAASNVCQDQSIQLTASGGNVYNWQPGSSLDDSTSAHPLASPLTNTNYTVQITDTVCNQTATLNTSVSILPLPDVRVVNSNDLDCSNDNSQLLATGAVQYQWSPSTALDNPFIPNPVASPTMTTQYIVKGTDQNGCVNTDTVTVQVLTGNKGQYLMPSAFTPNNDGRNDCYGVKYWGVIYDFELSIYNRWGERVFHTTNPSQCWDGTYKGLPQKADVYVYVVKAKTFCESAVFRKGTFALIR